MRKVLYVDDEETNLILFHLSLKKHFEVITTSNAMDGLEILEKDPGLKVVVSDLKMPHMNGLDFINRIKEGNRKTACIMLSGYVESEVMLGGFNRDHIFKYLMKPWNKDQLIATIEEAFEEVSG